ncbi:hypothetical protein V2W45_1367597 [Cenococcum geophilum]
MSYGAHSFIACYSTEPCGLQCSTYYLQLPYLYAIPLLIVSTLLHGLYLRVSLLLTLLSTNVEED